MGPVGEEGVEPQVRALATELQHHAPRGALELRALLGPNNNNNNIIIIIISSSSSNINKMINNNNKTTNNRNNNNNNAWTSPSGRASSGRAAAG